MSSNQFGTVSKLNISIEKSNTTDGKKDILSHVNFTAPFKIMNPFYDEHNNMSVMIMSASAGIMEGDCQDILIEVGKNANGKIYSQSFEKIHKMQNGSAKRDTTIAIKQGGFLEYSPLPTIPFAKSRFISNTQVHLEDKTSGFIFSDILSAGRIAQDERFEYSLYQSKVFVYCADELIYFDNASYEPAMFDMNGFCLQEGYSHQSSLLLFNIDVDVSNHLEQIQRYIESISEEQGIVGGYSQTASGDIVLRFLGNAAEPLQKIHSNIIQIIYAK